MDEAYGKGGGNREDWGGGEEGRSISAQKDSTTGVKGCPNAGVKSYNVYLPNLIEQLLVDVAVNDNILVNFRAAMQSESFCMK